MLQTKCSNYAKEMFSVRLIKTCFVKYSFKTKLQATNKVIIIENFEHYFEVLKKVRLDNH